MRHDKAMPLLQAIFTAASWVSIFLLSAVLLLVLWGRGRYRSEAGHLAFVSYTKHMRIATLILVASMVFFLIGEIAEFLADTITAYPMQRVHLAFEAVHMSLVALAYGIFLSITVLVRSKLK